MSGELAWMMMWYTYIIIINGIKAVNPIDPDNIMAIWKVWDQREWKIYPDDVQKIIYDTFDNGIISYEAETDAFNLGERFYKIISVRNTEDDNLWEYRQVGAENNDDSKVVFMDYVTKDKKEPIVDGFFEDGEDIYDRLPDEASAPARQYRSTEYQRATQAVLRHDGSNVIIWKYTDVKPGYQYENAFTTDVADHLEMAYLFNQMFGISSFIMYSAENIIPRFGLQMFSECDLADYIIKIQDGRIKGTVRCAGNADIYAELSINAEVYDSKNAFLTAYHHFRSLLQ